jgi:solute carrier family 44 (choline transporter-like protein), member 2/4/5
LLAAAGFAIVIAFLLMFLMRWIAPLMIWLSIFGTIFIFIGAGFIFLYNSGALSAYNDQLGNLGIPTLSANSHYNIYAGICFGVALVLIILLLCCCSRIRLAIAVCNVAGQFVVRVAQVMLVPIIMGLIIIGFWAFAIASLAYIIGTATFVANGDIFTSISDYTQRSLGMFYYFFFGTLWTSAFLDALTIFVIASACCMWYFSRGPGD